MTPDQLTQYNQQITASPITMTAGGAAQGVNNFQGTPAFNLIYGPQTQSNFFQSPQAQLMYGSQAANQMSAQSLAGTYDPIQAFQNADPSYQYQIDQAMRNVNNNSAARGLLESGQTQRDLLNTAQNMQNQQYQTWLGNQQNLYGNYANSVNNMFGTYQNQLAALTALGSQQTGSQNAFTAGQNQAQNIFAGNLATGQAIANANLSTGSNISSLLANQGVLNAGAILNTAAAQSNNLFQGNQFAAQLMGNVMGSNAQTQTGNASAQGFGRMI